MSDLYWLTDEQMARLEPFVPKCHGRPTVDDRRVLSGIIFVNRNGLRWWDAPAAYGPHKTLYNRWKRWSEAGVFVRMMEGLSGAQTERRTVMIEATYLKAHRTASSLAVKGGLGRLIGRTKGGMNTRPPDRLPLRHGPRRYRALLAMSPEPRSRAGTWARGLMRLKSGECGLARTGSNSAPARSSAIQQARA
jgi:transposase